MRYQRLLGAPEVSDRGWRYGMSVFETWAIFHGRSLFFEEHAQRLAAAAEALLGPQAAAAAMQASSAAAHPGISQGVARVYVSAGPGEMGQGDAFPSAWILEEETEVKGGPGPGVALRTFSSPYLPMPGGWKTANYWPNMRALAEARTSGAQEALMFGIQGQLIGCACANLFVRLDEQWLTPALDCGARNGVIRSWVMQRLKVREAWIERSELARLREAFFTNSRVGIAKVREVDGRPLNSCPTADELAEEYVRNILRP